MITSTLVTIIRIFILTNLFAKMKITFSLYRLFSNPPSPHDLRFFSIPAPASLSIAVANHLVQTSASVDRLELSGTVVAFRSYLLLLLMSGLVIVVIPGRWPDLLLPNPSRYRLGLACRFRRHGFLQRLERLRFGWLNDLNASCKSVK